MKFEKKIFKSEKTQELKGIDDTLKIRKAEKNEHIIANNKTENNPLNDEKKQQLIRNAQIAQLKILKMTIKQYQDNSRLLNQQEKAKKIEELSKRIKELENIEQIDSVEQIEGSRRRSR